MDVDVVGVGMSHHVCYDRDWFGLICAGLLVLLAVSGCATGPVTDQTNDCLYDAYGRLLTTDKPYCAPTAVVTITESSDAP
mgnify:CR=1 FL=1